MKSIGARGCKLLSGRERTGTLLLWEIFSEKTQWKMFQLNNLSLISFGATGQQIEHNSSPLSRLNCIYTSGLVRKITQSGNPHQLNYASGTSSFSRVGLTSHADLYFCLKWNGNILISVPSKFGEKFWFVAPIYGQIWLKLWKFFIFIFI